MKNEFDYHQPVLLEEVLSFVDHKKCTFIDLTLGRAGHSLEILKKISEGSCYVGVDYDQKAIDYSSKLLESYSSKCSLNFIHSSYANAFSKIYELGIKSADYILMDIGVSSPQFDDPERGFSYRYNAYLDMRMDQRQEKTASIVVNTYSADELEEVFTKTQCPCARRVARRIVEERGKKEIKETFELVDIIRSALPFHELNKKGHPAKQFFLALRYEVNNELKELEKGLEESLDFLSLKGRLIVISFNYQEDKIVKEHFNKRAKKAPIDKRIPVIEEEKLSYLNLTKKPIVPSEEELERNNRAKSAIMRVIERIDDER